MLELKLQYFGHLMQRKKKRPWCWERLRAGGEGGDRGWDGWMASLLNGHEFEQTQGVNKGQGSLVCCRSRGCTVGHDERLNNTRFRVKPNRIWIPVLPLTSYGFLAKLLNASEPLFLHLLNGDNKSTYLLKGAVKTERQRRQAARHNRFWLLI